MNWHRAPELLDRLAAEYALGTLAGGARRRFETVMRTQPVVAQAAARWQARLQPMDDALAPLPASEALWARIEGQAFGASAVSSSSSSTAGASAAAGRVQRWWQRWLAPVPAGALAFGLMLGIGAPSVFRVLQQDAQQGQLPESYVGVLATADGRQGLIVSSLRRGRVVDFKPVRVVPVPAGQVLFLWTIDAQGRAEPVGALPALPAGGFASLTLAQPAEAVFQRAVELAVSIERAGSRPAQPDSAFVYRGLCGKMWPPPPPASSPAR